MTPSAVLVTGANGFFGCHLLWELQQRGIRRLRCLVRGSDTEQISQKLQSALKAHQLPLAFEPIEVVAADLAKADFGLPPEDLAQLTCGIDTIVHAGACVNFTASADQMQRTNVEATKTLLDLAKTTGVRRFIQISSLAVVNGLDWPEGTAVAETPIAVDQPSSAGHYGRSKLAAEQACINANSSSGLEVCVLRLPYLLASSTKQSINPSGYLDVVLRAVLLLGQSFDDAFNVHPLPVDQCAAWVGAVATAPTAPLIAHVLHRGSMPWQVWLDAAEAMGQPIGREPMAQWYRRLRQSASDSRDPRLLEAIAFLKLEPTHQRWMHMNAHRLEFDNHNLSALVAEASQPQQLSMAYKQAILRGLLLETNLRSGE